MFIYLQYSAGRVIGNTVKTNETENKAQFLKSLHSLLVPHHVHIGCHRLRVAGAQTCSGAGGSGLLALSLPGMVAHDSWGQGGGCRGDGLPLLGEGLGDYTTDGVDRSRAGGSCAGGDRDQDTGPRAG